MEPHIIVIELPTGERFAYGPLDSEAQARMILGGDWPEDQLPDAKTTIMPLFAPADLSAEVAAAIKMR